MTLGAAARRAIRTTLDETIIVEAAERLRLLRRASLRAEEQRERGWGPASFERCRPAAAKT